MIQARLSTMLISSEAFYISCLEGKSQQDIMKQIHSMKREIKRLRKIIDEWYTVGSEDIFFR